MFCTSTDGIVSMWNISSGRCCDVMQKHSGPIHASVYCYTSHCLYSAGADAKVWCWNLALSISQRSSSSQDGSTRRKPHSSRSNSKWTMVYAAPCPMSVSRLCVHPSWCCSHVILLSTDTACWQRHLQQDWSLGYRQVNRYDISPVAVCQLDVISVTIRTFLNNAHIGAIQLVNPYTNALVLAIPMHQNIVFCLAWAKKDFLAQVAGHTTLDISSGSRQTSRRTPEIGSTPGPSTTVRRPVKSAQPSSRTSTLSGIGRASSATTTLSDRQRKLDLLKKSVKTFKEKTSRVHKQLQTIYECFGGPTRHTQIEKIPILLRCYKG